MAIIAVITTIEMKAQKQIVTEITINATAEEVWAVLVKNEDYGSWNPLIIESTGEIIKGGKLKNTLQTGEKTMVFKPKITELTPNKRFEWLGHLLIPGIFDGRHFFELKELENGQTLFIHGENFKGILSGFILKSIGEDTTQNFIKMNKALKKKVENNS